MKHKGCNNCVHHKSTFNDDNLVSRCMKGNQKEYNLWWQNNGHKKSDDDDVDEMPCFEQTDVSKAMDRMHDLLDEMLDLVDNIKKS